jgi:hypothetical protein
LSIAKELISVFNNLVCPTNKVKVILTKENLQNIRPKNKRNSSFIVSPLFDFFIRIRPKQVTEKA